MVLSRGGAGVSSAYPVVSDVMGYEQTAAAGTKTGSYASTGGALELRRPAYPSMKSQPAVAPLSSSSYHFGAGSPDNPGLGGIAAGPAPVGGGYGGGGMVGSGEMDADLQVLINNDLFEAWSKAAWGL